MEQLHIATGLSNTEGGCYYAGAVNYLLLGKMNSLCNSAASGDLTYALTEPFDSDYAAAVAFGRKKYMAWDEDREVSMEDIQAVYFTYEGFGDGNVS